MDVRTQNNNKKSHTPSLWPVFQQLHSSEEKRHNVTFSNNTVLVTDMLLLQPKKKPVNLTMPSSKSLPKGFCKCRTEDTKLLKQYYYNI